MIRDFWMTQECLLVPLKSHLPDPSFIWLNFLYLNFTVCFAGAGGLGGGRARGKGENGPLRSFVTGNIMMIPDVASGSTVTIMSNPHFFYYYYY